MANITASQYLDSGTARTAGEVFTVSDEAVFTIRTDSRIHANAPASFTGAFSSPLFSGTGGEIVIDARNVRWLAYTGGSGNAPAIGTSITQGGVSGYYLGCWGTIGGAPVAVGAAIPASGFIKLREVTGGTYSAGALTGITATASGADVAGWIEIAWDAGVNFVVGRIGKFTTRGDWFYLANTNGAVEQTIPTPTSSSTSANNFCPGCWVETSPGSDVFEFWPGLSSAANMWIRTALGFPEGSTDRRGRFVKTYAGGNVQFGETATMTGTYVTVAGQASTYAGIAIAGTYVWANDKITITTASHLLDTGMSVYFDFTTGSGVNGYATITVLDAYNIQIDRPGSGTGGNVTCRPGVTVTFTAHGYNAYESVYCDFTTGTGVDGTYQIYAVTGANTYNIAYPHAAALTSGNVTANGRLQATLTAHGHAVGNEVYLDFTSGAGVDGKYTIRAVATNTIDINYPFSAAIASSNVTARWTIGHVPPSGCRVRIPNILWAECATAARATNTVPNATIASRPEFTTTTAGAIDLEYLYILSGRSIFDQAYSVRLQHCAFSETLQITECATALDVNDVGVGQYSAQDARALQLTSNFAGGTVSNVVANRATLGTTDHAMDVSYCKGITFNNIEAGVIGYARNTGKPLIVLGCNTLTFNGVRLFNGNCDITVSSKITINDLDYNDRFIGRTSATTPYYALTAAAGCSDITLNGVTFGMGNTIPDCHPYTGIFNATNVVRSKIRNLGTAASSLQTGVWSPNLYGCGYIFATGGNNEDIKIQRAFVGKLRTGTLSYINSDNGVLLEQITTEDPWYYSAKTVRTDALAYLNATVKGMTTGAELTTGQTSVYGTHFLSQFRGSLYGFILLAMNEPTAATAQYWSNPAGVAKFTSAGTIEMRAIGAEAIWEMDYFAKGHTGFANITPVMSGGTIGNYTITYQIDTGSGWNETWKTLNTTNLTAEIVSSTTGFKLKIRIVTSTTNSTAISFLRIYTSTSKAAQDAIDYPLDTNNLSFSGVPFGTDMVVLEAGTSNILYNINGDTSNFVQGGSFSSVGDLTYWDQGSAPIDIVDGHLALSSPANGNYPGRGQIIAGLVPGASYTLSGKIRKGPEVTVKAMIDIAGQVYQTDATTDESFSLPFTATTATHNLAFYIGGDPIPEGHTIYADDLNIVGGPPISYKYVYSGTDTVDVGFVKPGYVPFYIRNLSIGTTDMVLPISLTVDRNYS